MNKCPECGKEIVDGWMVCPNCGFPLDSELEVDDDNNVVMQEEQNSKTPQDIMIDNISDNSAVDSSMKKKNSKKSLLTIASIVICAVIVIIIVVAFTSTSDSGKYKKAQRLMDSEDYEKAMAIYEELGDYEDSESLYVEASHKYDIQNDVSLPELKNIPESESLSVGQDFDTEDWISENDIYATDDVSGLLNCVVNAEALDTDNPGEYTISISATDEAGNEAVSDVIVIVKDAYTQEEIADVVKSTYSKDIPALYDITYDTESNVVYIYLLEDGMADNAIAAMVYSSVKDSWDELTEAFDDTSKTIYQHVISEGYTDVKMVSIVLLNDENTSKVLYATANGITISDVTD